MGPESAPPAPRLANGGTPRRRPLFQRGGSLTVCAGLIILLAIAARAIPHEVSRWYLAAALECRLRAESARAIGYLDRAITWEPRDGHLYQLRAAWRLEANLLEASLADCDQAIELVSDDTSTRMLRSGIYQRLGRHREAIEDWGTIVARRRDEFNKDPASVMSRSAYAISLNNHAYARALGNMEIDLGLEEIQQAFAIIGTEDRYVMLDTRGYLRYLAGDDLDGARDDLERAIELAEASASIDRPGHPAVPSAPDVIVSPGNDLAVLYHHRGLIYEKLGRSREAAADLELARKLGYDPEKGVW